MLSDPETRKRYDRFGDDYRQVPDDWEQRVGAASGPRGGRWPSPVHPVRGRDRGLRRRLRRRRSAGSTWRTCSAGCSAAGVARGPVQGADQEAELPLTVEEAYRGGRREITLNGPGGPRTYTVTSRPASRTAGASGCPARAARGWAAGRPATSTWWCGLLPHQRYRVEGKDITVELRVAPWEAALGATVPVPTPGGGDEGDRSARHVVGTTAATARARACPIRAAGRATSTPK